MHSTTTTTTTTTLTQSHNQNQTTNQMNPICALHPGDRALASSPPAPTDRGEGSRNWPKTYVHPFSPIYLRRAPEQQRKQTSSRGLGCPDPITRACMIQPRKRAWLLLQQHRRCWRDLGGPPGLHTTYGPQAC